jgi:hypothetical protein
MPLHDPYGSAVWSARSEAIGVALWTSFIIACCETMIIFAFLDPATLGLETLAPSLMALRPMLYGLGFFFLWSFAFIAAGLTAYMLESGPGATARSARVATQSDTRGEGPCEPAGAGSDDGPVRQ